MAPVTVGEPTVTAVLGDLVTAARSRVRFSQGDPVSNSGLKSWAFTRYVSRGVLWGQCRNPGEMRAATLRVPALRVEQWLHRVLATASPSVRQAVAV